MKTKLFNAAAIFFSLWVITSSCNDEDRLSGQDTQDISEEALTDSYFQDMDDMAGVAVQAPSENEFGNGRTKGTITVSDIRFRCDGQALPVTIELAEGSTIDHPMGTITVDFGDGCTDLRNNTRTGKLIFTYNGRRFMPESTISVTGVNYTINGVKLEGVRTLTNKTGSTSEAPTFNTTLENGKATFEDGTFATRESDITWTWVRAANPTDDKLVISSVSTASGTTRGGRSYAVSLLEDIEYKRFCGLAVSGVKKYVIDQDKEIVIDYGDGECDKSITVTINGGVSRTITVN